MSVRRVTHHDCLGTPVRTQVIHSKGRPSAADPGRAAYSVLGYAPWPNWRMAFRDDELLFEGVVESPDEYLASQISAWEDGEITHVTLRFGAVFSAPVPDAAGVPRLFSGIHSLAGLPAGSVEWEG